MIRLACARRPGRPYVFYACPKCGKRFPARWWRWHLPRCGSLPLFDGF
ncbi:MAG: hypothetical protein HY822_18230 [Acidobacteria bacterium]|nr:hypothetical protein [Acidobacteriota bacterium]